MELNSGNLKNFIEQLKTIGFLERLFNWKKVKNQLVDAAGDLQRLISTIDNLKVENIKLDNSILSIKKDLELKNHEFIKSQYEIEKHYSALQENTNKIARLSTDLCTKQEANRNLQISNTNLQNELALHKEKLSNIERELKKVIEQNTKLMKDDDFRKHEYSHSVATLNKIQEQIHTERKREIEDKNEIEIKRIRSLKETWSNHQINVKNIVKSICSRHIIEYVESVPFKGNPDNTLKICDEFVILDAKSPASDDLTNFPFYLRDQVEKAKKYANQECVKTDIMFIVPSNTLEILSTFVYRLADYNVYIISIDSLEPVILSLQKIEDYEFAEQLSPEERENICRILGKFAHLSKRRIQVDSFFAKQFIELAYKCESDLPADILDKVKEFEKSEKLNPPMERRAKSINTNELEKDTVKIKNEIITRGIIIEDEKISIGLNQLPLYQNGN